MYRQKSMLAKQIEEAEKQVAAATTPPQLIEALLQLASQLFHSEPERAIVLTERVFRLLEQAGEGSPNYDFLMGEAFFQMGNAYLRKGNFQEALHFLPSAIERFQTVQNQAQVGFATISLGLTYLYIGNYPDALNSFLQALEIGQTLQEVDIQVRVLNNLGYLYILLQEYPKAMMYLEQCQEIAEANGVDYGFADALDNMGNISRQLGQLDQAIVYHEYSLRVNQRLQDWRGETETLMSLGDDHVVLGNDTAARSYYSQALDSAEQHQYLYQKVVVLIQLGKLCGRQKEWETAVFHLHTALSQAQTLNLAREQFQCHHLLADLYKQAGAFEKALFHFEQFYAYEKVVFNDETDKRLKNLELIHQVEKSKQQAEIYQLKNIALQHEINERELLIAELKAFAHTVAHDLKTPLTAVIGYSELLIEDLANSLSPENFAYLQNIQRSGKKLSSVIDEILLLATVRHQEIEPNPIDMAKVIAEVELRLTSQITADTTLTKPAEWPVAVGYAPWVEEVWSNFISNGIKYGGRPPHLVVGADSLPNNLVRFWVRDNGDGIQADQKVKLFTTFTRLDTKRAAGHGLGLSIVKRIVERLGGNTGVESAGVPGQGSLFWFTLPTNNL